MNILNLKNVKTEHFENALKDFKMFIPSDFAFDNHTQSLTTYAKEFDKFHLVMLGKAYGATLFRSKMKLRLLQYQSFNLEIEKKYNTPNTQIATDWGDEIEVSTHIVFNAESYMLHKLYNYLNDESKELLHKKMPKLSAKQSVYSNTPGSFRYAFNILGNTLVLIKENKASVLISDLWRIEWYEA